MLNTMTTQERKDRILERIKTRAESCWDEVVNLISLGKRCDSPDFYKELTNKLKKINVSSHAKGQLLNRLNIFASYLNRCPEWLQAEKY